MAAADLKAQGNAAFSAGKFADAVEHFSSAISLDPSDHVLYSNRSAAYASMQQYQPALADAKRVVELKADWPKGFSRLGAAHFGLSQWAEAAAAYTQGLALDPDNGPLQQGLKSVQAAQASQQPPRWQPGAGTGAAAATGGRAAKPVEELVLLVAHVVLILSALVSLQPFNRYLGWQAYAVCCRTALVASGYKIFLRFGLPSFRPFPTGLSAWMQQAAGSTELFHFLLSTLMMQAPQLWMGVVLLAVTAAYPALAALGRRFGSHPLWQRYGSRAQAWLETNKPAVLRFGATAEIMLGFQLALAILQTGLRGAMLAYVLWNHLRLRYWAPESRPYHQQAWAVINARVQPVFNAVPALRRYLDHAVRWFQQPGQHQPHRN